MLLLDLSLGFPVYWSVVCISLSMQVPLVHHLSAGRRTVLGQSRGVFATGSWGLRHTYAPSSCLPSSSYTLSSIWRSGRCKFFYLYRTFVERIRQQSGREKLGVERCRTVARHFGGFPGEDRKGGCSLPCFLSADCFLAFCLMFLSFWRPFLQVLSQHTHPFIELKC